MGFLLTAAEGAADGIEPEQFRRLNRLGREMFVSVELRARNTGLRQ
jgi:hypothetical protein